MGVGSVATRHLADFGAEVIKIEDRTRIDLPRRLPIYKDGPARAFGQEDENPDVNKGGLFNNFCRNKLGVTINMRTPAGRELADRLIAASSVVTENFAPGVMERWGLTYERLGELSPEVIYARMSGYGHSGPYTGYRSYGPVVQAVSGLSFISGLPGREPSGWGLSYMDNQAAYYNAAAVLLAIYHRNRTGQGTEIDVSAIEVGATLIGPTFLDVTANGRPTRRADFPTGNRLEHPAAAPHGVYPVLGEDRWIAIAVFDDEEWRGLVAEMGEPEWCGDARFATHAARVANQDALDEHLRDWTRRLEPHEATRRLQARGVRAGTVQNAEDLTEHDPQAAHREVFFELDHPVIGPARFEATPLHFSAMAQDNWRSAPLLGEDNEYVFKELLGVSGRSTTSSPSRERSEMEANARHEHPYAGLRVVELADDPAGEMSGKFLADMGADVVKIESPGGSASRHIGPFATTGQALDSGDTSLNYCYYNTNKRSAVLDVGQPEGRRQLEALLGEADLLISTRRPVELERDGFDLEALHERFPTLLILSVTPFGLDGPWKDWVSSDLVALALGGPLNSCGYDDHSIPPIRPGGGQAFHSAASFAHIGLLLALIDRQRTGQGQIIDVAMHDCLAAGGAELANPYWFYPRALVQRQTCRHAQPVPTQPTIFPCRDGRYVYFVLIIAEQKPWRALVEWLASHGLAADLADPAYLDAAHRRAHFHHIQGVVEVFFLLMEAADLYHEGQARGLPVGILNSPEDLLGDEHFRARNFFVAVDHDGRQVEYPGSPYRFSAFEPVPLQRAPKLGENTDTVLDEIHATRPAQAAAGGG